MKNPCHIAKRIMDCCNRNSCKNWDNSFSGNCILNNEDFEYCKQVNYYKFNCKKKG